MKDEPLDAGYQQQQQDKILEPMKDQDLAEQFEQETGTPAINTQGEPDIDYVAWLEKKVNDQPIDEVTKFCESRNITPLDLINTWKEYVKMAVDSVQPPIDYSGLAEKLNTLIIIVTGKNVPIVDIENQITQHFADQGEKTFQHACMHKDLQLLIRAFQCKDCGMVIDELKEQHFTDHGKACVSSMNNKTVSVSESADNESQGLEAMAREFVDNSGMGVRYWNTLYYTKEAVVEIITNVIAEKMPCAYKGELNTERIKTYTKLSKSYNIQIDTVRDIFNAGINYITDKMKKP